MKQYEVTIANSDKTFVVKEGENILAAALRQGVMLPYSCKNGTCGSCKMLQKTMLVACLLLIKLYLILILYQLCIGL